MQSSTHHNQAPHTLTDRDKPLLLVAAPDLVIRRMLQGVLEDYGYQVMTAGNCAEMTALFTRHQPDLVLVDLGTPDGHTFNACTLLRRLAGDKPLPMLVMADQGGAKTVERIFKAGATDFYVKPINPLLLKEKIRQSLHYRDIELALSQVRHTADSAPSTDAHHAVRQNQSAVPTSASPRPGSPH